MRNEGLLSKSACWSRLNDEGMAVTAADETSAVMRMVLASISFDGIYNRCWQSEKVLE
jgi:hypothetical protein